MRTHTWEDPEIYHIQTQNQAKQDGQRKPRGNAPYKWFKLPRARDSLSESARVCLLTRTLFLPNTHSVSILSVFVGIHFCKAEGPRGLSLATSLVARIQRSHCHSLTSISGWELKSCFKRLQAEATRDQNQIIMTPLLLTFPSYCLSDLSHPSSVSLAFPIEGRMFLPLEEGGKRTPVS